MKDTYLNINLYTHTNSDFHLHLYLTNFIVYWLGELLCFNRWWSEWWGQDRVTPHCMSPFLSIMQTLSWGFRYILWSTKVFISVLEAKYCTRQGGLVKSIYRLWDRSENVFQIFQALGHVSVHVSDLQISSRETLPWASKENYFLHFPTVL